MASRRPNAKDGFADDDASLQQPVLALPLPPHLMQPTVGFRNPYHIACFAIAVLQMLFRCQRLREHYAAGTCARVGRMNRLMFEMAARVTQRLAQHPPIAAMPTSWFIDRLPAPLNDFLQQDSAEFFGLLYNALHEECHPPQQQPLAPSCMADTLAWRTLSTTTCCACGAEYAKIEQAHDIHVHIQPNSDLQQLVDAEMGSVEVVDQIRDCPNCKQKTQAQNRIFLLGADGVDRLSPGRHLCVVIKRFHFDGSTRQAGKLFNVINIPEYIAVPVAVPTRQQLNEIQLVRDNDTCCFVQPFAPAATMKRIHFRLIAAVIHMGPTMDTGHYIALLRDDASRSWIHCDDHSVNVCDRASAESLLGRRPPERNDAQAYMLMFERVDSVLQQQQTSKVRQMLPPRVAEVRNVHHQRADTANNRQDTVYAVCACCSEPFHCEATVVELPVCPSCRDNDRVVSLAKSGSSSTAHHDFSDDSVATSLIQQPQDSTVPSSQRPAVVSGSRCAKCFVRFAVGEHRRTCSFCFRTFHRAGCFPTEKRGRHGQQRCFDCVAVSCENPLTPPAVAESPTVDVNEGVAPNEIEKQPESNRAQTVASSKLRRPRCGWCKEMIHKRQHSVLCLLCQKQFHKSGQCFPSNAEPAFPLCRECDRSVPRSHHDDSVISQADAETAKKSTGEIAIAPVEAAEVRREAVALCNGCNVPLQPGSRRRRCYKCGSIWHLRCANATFPFQCSTCVDVSQPTRRDILLAHNRRIADEDDEILLPPHRVHTESKNRRSNRRTTIAETPLDRLQADYNVVEEWMQCRWCETWLLTSEARQDYCCNKKQAILAEECWPWFSKEYRQILLRYKEHLFTSSNFINQCFALANLRVCGPTTGRAGEQFDAETLAAEARAGFRLEYGRACNVHLGGRTYVQFDPNNVYLTMNEVTNRADEAYDSEERRAVLNALYEYFEGHNDLMMHCQGKLRQFLEEAKRIQGRSAVAASVEMHPDDAATNQQATAAIGRVGADITALPRIAADPILQLPRENFDTSTNYEPYVFPMLLPLGIGGWMRGGKFQTVLQFTKRVVYQRLWDLMLLPRVAEELLLDQYSRMQQIRCAQLLHKRQVVDQYARRMASVAEVRQALESGNAEVELRHVGRQWSVPASIQHSPQALRERIEDNLAVINDDDDSDDENNGDEAEVQQKGPSLFITLTYPKDAPELTTLLHRAGLDHHTAFQHPAVTVRIFRARLSKLRQFLYDGVLGSKVKYFLRVVEFQKRGLIHAHIIVRLRNHPVSAAQVDELVTCRLFYAERCPNKKRREDKACTCIWHKLTRLVSTYMMHDCKSVNLRCHKNGKCTKGYPQEATPYTYLHQDGMWRYRRTAEDVWVVPYNITLLIIFTCHLNVVCCSGPGAAAYICKYTNKGCDTIRIRLQPTDEQNGRALLAKILDQWQRMRHLSSSEAALTLMQMHTTDSSPSVQKLAVHDEDGQLIEVQADDVDATAQAAATKRTTLMDWLDRPEQLRHLGYCQFFKRYTVEYANNRLPLPPLEMLIRNGHPPLRHRYAVLRNTRVVARIRRITFVPANRQMFCLRLILAISKAMSWAELKGGHATYEAYAAELGLFDCDDEHRFAMRDTINSDPRVWRELDDEQHHPVSLVLRTCTAEDALRMFCIIAINNVSNAAALFEEFWPYFLRSPPWLVWDDDYMAARRQEALIAVDARLQQSRYDNASIGLEVVYRGPQVVETELARYPKTELQAFLSSAELSDEQVAFVHEVYMKVVDKQQALYHLNGSAGTGKTYAVTYLLAKLRSEEHICLPTAFMAATSQRVDGGDTCHRLFGLPVDPDIDTKDYVESSLGELSNNAILLRSASLLLIDEISMLHRAYFDCIDNTMRHLSNAPDQPFGGKTVVVVGDFKQLGAVTKAADCVSTVATSVASSPVWMHFQPRRFYTQHRVLDPDYAAWVEDVGYGVDNGVCNDGFHEVTLPDAVETMTTVDEWYEKTVDETNFSAILLATHNNIVNEHNDAIRKKHAAALGLTPREQAVLYSVTKLERGSEPLSMVSRSFGSVEVLQKANVSSVPLHELRLHKGASLTLLRNLDPRSGLCNGTRLTVDSWTKYVLFVTIRGGRFNGQQRHLPRITFKSTAYRAVPFSRLQFPVKLAYCLTINRAQGETWRDTVVGLDLRQPIFAHGQLYVALSRVEQSSQLRILLPENGLVINVVYQDLLIKAGDYDERALNLARQRIFPHADQEEDDVEKLYQQLEARQQQRQPHREEIDIDDEEDYTKVDEENALEEALMQQERLNDLMGDVDVDPDCVLNRKRTMLYEDDFDDELLFPSTAVQFADEIDEEEEDRFYEEAAARYAAEMNDDEPPVEE